VWDRLTPAQQAAIYRTLEVPNNPRSAPLARAAVLIEDPLLEGMAKQYIDLYSARLPSVVPVPIVKVFQTNDDIGAPADSFRSSCRIPRRPIHHSITAGSGWHPT